MNVTRVLLLACVVLFAFPATHAAEPFAEKLDRLFNFGSSFEEPEFLDPDQAFIVSADVVDSTRLKLRWEIADGYYLYRDKFGFTLDDPGVTPAPVVLPAGKVKEDPAFGSVEVFYGTVEVVVPLTREVMTTLPVNLAVAYQGCKDGSICYPPLTKNIPLLLPAVDSGGSAPPEQLAGTGLNETIISSQDAISNSLKQSSVLINMLVFFGFGLLLALTPCIFPMIPILSGIIIGQSEQITPYRAFLLSLAYVLAMALTYAMLGVIAGSSGFNLQAAAQNPWVITAFSLVFVLLALSMFGFYELQLPVSWQNRLATLGKRQQHGNLAGAAVMGVLSAIIVGPCVAPPLAGALIYISQTGDALLGGGALFALGLGMGMPLIILGSSAGKLLPRAGAWMVTVKQIFGVVMLGVAIWFMGRILPAPLTLFLWGLLLVVTSVYMGVFDRLEAGATWKKLWKGVGTVFLVYGVALVLGAASGGGDVFRPLQWAGYQSAATEYKLQFAIIKSVDDLDRVLAEAERTQQAVMLDFYADWCITCKEMERFTFPDPAVRTTLQDLLLVKADVTKNDAVDQALMQRFDVIGPPSILFFVRGQERREYRLAGFVGSEEFASHIRNVKAAL